MKKETYIKLTDFFKSRSWLLRILRFLYTALPIVMFIAYLIIIVLKGIEGFGHEFLLTVIVPAVTLLGVGIIRKLINRERPYEKFGVSSVIEKSKKGQSFPSNHGACACVIAMTGFGVSPALGFGLLAVALIIALTRIFSGVHFISDVLAGAATGILMGSIFLFI